MNEVLVLIGRDVTCSAGLLLGSDPQSQPYGIKTSFRSRVAGLTNKIEDKSKPVSLPIRTTPA